MCMTFRSLILITQQVFLAALQNMEWLELINALLQLHPHFWYFFYQ